MMAERLPALKSNNRSTVAESFYVNLKQLRVTWEKKPLLRKFPFYDAVIGRTVRHFSD